MTPQEIKEAVKALADEMGSKAYVSIDVKARGAQLLSACAYPDGLTANNSPSIHLTADDWPEAIAALRERWTAMSADHRSETIKKMALAIIRLTAEQGECSDAALRAEFSSSDVDRYADEACASADEMASNGPFRVSRLSGANAA